MTVRPAPPAAGTRQTAEGVDHVAVTPAVPPFAGGARPPAALRPEAVYLAGLAPAGRRSMAARLLTVAGVLGAPSLEAVPWEQLRYAHVAAIRAALEERELAPASVNATLAALSNAERGTRNAERRTAARS
jgi:hypothetical protein